MTSTSTLPGGEPPEKPAGSVGLLPTHPRYTLHHILGAGGGGEVWCAHDALLGRDVAMKILRRRSAREPSAVRQFHLEARLLARLQYPSIVPVYDWGQLSDGRPFLTMPIISGRTLREQVYQSPATDGALLRRRVGYVCAVSDAISYAHEVGVLHRDIKPANVIVGRFEQVLVLDWGIALIQGAPALDGVRTAELSVEDTATRTGQVKGTLGFISPEQAIEGAAVDQRTDVFGLGGLLFSVMTGGVPWGLKPKRALRRARSGEVLLVPQPHRFPAQLVAICQRALRPDPDERYPTASAFSAALRSWLEREDDQRRARVLVQQAAGAIQQSLQTRAAAEQLQVQAAAVLRGLPPGADESERHAAWALEDQARDQQERALLLETQHEQYLHIALSHAPELPEAHAGLAALYRERHGAAEHAGDRAAAARYEYLLRQHSHGRYERYLRGVGGLRLEAARPARAVVSRLEMAHRRLQPERVLSGRLPLQAELPIGSYLAEITSDDGVVVRYPFVVSRDEEARSGPLWLPPPSLSPELVYVAEGWFWSGGDREEGRSLPLRRVWVDGFFVSRSQVTNREYLRFLNALVAAGRADEADALCPRERSAPGVYVRDQDGEYRLGPDADGDLWSLDWPVFLVDYHCAASYAAWRAAETGLPYRLIDELEWEKAARGADRRMFVWGGNTIDPLWARTGLSARAGARGPCRTGAHPIDTSVYGVEGLSGNVSDICRDAFHPDGPPVADGRWSHQPISTGMFTLRGGNWNASPARARVCWRGGSEHGNRSYFAGFRVALSVGALS